MGSQKFKLFCPVHKCETNITAHYTEKYRSKHDLMPILDLAGTICDLKRSGKSCPHIDCPLRKEIRQMSPLYEDSESYR